MKNAPTGGGYKNCAPLQKLPFFLSCSSYNYCLLRAKIGVIANADFSAGLKSWRLKFLPGDISTFSLDSFDLGDLVLDVREVFCLPSLGFYRAAWNADAV